MRLVSSWRWLALPIVLLSITPAEAQTAPAPTPLAEPPGPPVGSMSEEQIESYLDGLRDKVRAIADDLADARQRHDEERVERRRADLRQAKARINRERDRLTTRNTGLMIGGIVTTSLGFASLMASLVLGILYGIDDALGEPDKDLGRAAWYTLGGGALLLGAGVPMLVIGLRREPREAPSGPMQDIVRAKPSTVALTWVF